MRNTGWTVRLLAAGCAAALTTGCLSGCGSAKAASDVITLAGAKAVAQSWIHAALATEIAQEGGSLQRIDESFEAMRTPGPTPTPDPLVHEDDIWMAHQSGYPVSFLCIDRSVASGQSTAGQMFRFRKADAASPWTVTHQDRFLSLGSRPRPVLDADGYAHIVPAADYGRFLASPAKLGADLAAYLQANNASDGREFAPGEMTTGWLDQLKQLVDSGAAQHVATTFSFAATDDPVDAYLLSDGGALVLTGVQMTVRRVASSGSITVTDDGKGVMGPAPGSYHEVTTILLALGAFVVPPKGSAAKVSGIGIYSGTVATTAAKG